MNVAVCVNVPLVPVTVIVLLPTAAPAAAVSVTLCGVPGVTVAVEGTAVTPAGNPLSFTLTPALNPFTPVTDTLVDAPAPPAVTFTVVGLTPSEKSCASAATETMNVAAWLSVPEVPVTVTVPELAAALAAAVSVIVCGVPGITLTVAGAAVTPAGKPLSATATAELNPFSAVTVTVTVCPAAPPVNATVAGAAAIEKSGTNAVFELHPTIPKVIPSATAQRAAIRNPAHPHPPNQTHASPLL